MKASITARVIGGLVVAIPIVSLKPFYRNEKDTCLDYHFFFFFFFLRGWGGGETDLILAVPFVIFLYAPNNHAS